MIGLSFASHEVTGLEPLARVAFPGHPQDDLQQSQYLVVVPEPEACAFAWMKKGTSRGRIRFGRIIVVATKIWNFEGSKLKDCLVCCFFSDCDELPYKRVER